MSIYRKVGLFATSFLLRTSLFIGFTLLGAVIVFTNSENVKSALVEINAYDRFSQSIIDASIQQSEADPNSIPLSDPVLAGIIRESLNKEDLRDITEIGIDATYAWLNGETEKIEFSADVSKNKELLAGQSADYAVTRLNSLQPCIEVPLETNIFRLSCKPNYSNYDSLHDNIYQSLKEDDSIFKADILSEENFPKIVEGQKISETYPNASAVYTKVKAAPYILILLAVILSACIIMFSKTKLVGLRIVAMSLIGTGIILAIIPLLYIYIFPALGISFPSFGSGSQTESVSQITNELFDKLYVTFNTMLLNIAIQVAAAGIILYLLAKYLKPRYIDYAKIQKKAGVATSFKRSASKGQSSSSVKSVPVQTSEKPKKRKKRTSSLEKRFKKL